MCGAAGSASAVCRAVGQDAATRQQRAGSKSSSVALSPTSMTARTARSAPRPGQHRDPRALGPCLHGPVPPLPPPPPPPPQHQGRRPTPARPGRCRFGCCWPAAPRPWPCPAGSRHGPGHLPQSPAIGTTQYNRTTQREENSITSSRLSGRGQLGTGTGTGTVTGTGTPARRLRTQVARWVTRRGGVSYRIRSSRQVI